MATNTYLQNERMLAAIIVERVDTIAGLVNELNELKKQCEAVLGRNQQLEKENHALRVQASVVRDSDLPDPPLTGKETYNANAADS